jgi:alanine racemase
MRTWAEISLDDLAHNYRALRSCAPNSKFLGVVKANAYGHGAVPVARKLEELGADYLAVACLSEAEELRRAGLNAPILILGATPPEFAPKAVELDVTQAVFTMELAQALSDGAGRLGKRAKVHLKVDTGMSRLGTLADDPARCAGEIAALCALPNLEPEGIFTHFANADGDEGYTMGQFTRFLDVLDSLKTRHGLEFAIRHCAASAAVLNYPCTHLDMIRPGIALYGHYPDLSCEGLDGPGLRPVMTLKSRVAAVRALPGDTPVSYGCTARFGAEGGRVAVLPIGYADGLHRVLSNQGSVLLNGPRRPIMGRVCMDMCMIGLNEGDDAAPGDVAEVFGPNCPIEQDADLAGTIQYELLCAVSPRVPRVYR